VGKTAVVAQMLSQQKYLIKEILPLGERERNKTLIK